MQSDLGGEALFLCPRDQSGTALIPYVGVRRTNQEKRRCGTGAGFEAEVKIKLSVKGRPSRAVLGFGTQIRRLPSCGYLFSRVSGSDYMENEGCHSTAAVQRMKWKKGSRS